MLILKENKYMQVLVSVYSQNLPPPEVAIPNPHHYLPCFYLQAVVDPATVDTQLPEDHALYEPSPSPVHAMRDLDSPGVLLRGCSTSDLDGHVNTTLEALDDAHDTPGFEEEQPEEEELTHDEDVDVEEYQDNNTVLEIESDEECCMSPACKQPLKDAADSTGNVPKEHIAPEAPMSEKHVVDTGALGSSPKEDPEAAPKKDLSGGNPPDPSKGPIATTKEESEKVKEQKAAEECEDDVFSAPEEEMESSRNRGTFKVGVVQPRPTLELMWHPLVLQQ